MEDIMIIIVNEERLPEGAKDEDIRAFINLLLEDKMMVLSCYVEDRAGVKYLMRVSPGLDLLKQAHDSGKTPLDIVSKAEIDAAINNDLDDAELGSLSRRYESNGKPDEIGEDSTGGPSYGLYQLASYKGSVASFIRFLESAYPDFAVALNTAGGDAAARKKAPAFIAAWKKLSAIKEFSVAQHAFIKLSYYDRLVHAIKVHPGLGLSSRSKALRDVVWSIAVQHGPNTSLIASALHGIAADDLAKLDDSKIINALYEERSRVSIYFASSTDQVQKSVLNRFKKERADALAMLTA